MQDINAPQVTIRNKTNNYANLPTETNMAIWQLYISNVPTEDIAKSHNISPETVKYHIRQVRQYYKTNWQTDQYNLLQSKLSENQRLIGAATKLIDQGDSKTVNNLINRTIIPKETPNKRVTQVNFIANRINLGQFQQQDTNNTDAQVCSTVTDSNTIDAEYNIDTSCLDSIDNADYASPDTEQDDNQDD
jgi:DNA-binding CsgD family transcriptional regulator